MSDRAGTAGVVGLGTMGGAMTATLRRAGWDVVCTDPVDAARDAAAATGARPLADAAAVAALADVVILSLPDATIVNAVIDGPGGIAASARRGLTVVDTSTLAPADARAIGAKLAALGIGYLDTPVSGGPGGAVKGTLSVMVGGTPEDLERARAVLETIGSRVVRCGDVGAGSVAKACNQLIVVATIGAVAEALAIADASGVDPAAVREALLGGWAASSILDLHGARMVSGDWVPGGRAAFHLKDVDTLAALTAATGVHTAVFDAAAGYIRSLVERGGGELDHSAVYTIVRGATPAPAG
ncbi:MAG TPA: NAD(P)-dependent oxidoreductase [Candidatus Limnocylindrales bacterium]|nr:NAD(P)-dependent oxidoreductase [Candidatus Limnocylindrales bacterium]